MRKGRKGKGEMKRRGEGTILVAQLEWSEGEGKGGEGGREGVGLTTELHSRRSISLRMVLRSEKREVWTGGCMASSTWLERRTRPPLKIHEEEHYCTPLDLQLLGYRDFKLDSDKIIFSV